MKKTAKRELMSYPTVTVRWPKGSDGKKRFDAAVKKAGGNASDVSRELLDEWARLIHERTPSDIGQSARTVAAKKKK